MSIGPELCGFDTSTYQERDWKDAQACLCFQERTAVGDCPIAGLEPEVTLDCSKIVAVY